MGTDFFDELGETLTRTAKELGERAELIYGTQKLRNKIASERRIIDKTMADLGNILYKSYTSGAELDENQRRLCEQIDQHFEEIEKCKESMANLRGKKICPSCKETVDRSVAFCPHCGASCPDPEPESATAEEDIVEDVADFAERAAEVAENFAEKTAEAAEDLAGKTAEAAEDLAGRAAGAAENFAEKAAEVVEDLAEKAERAADKMEETSEKE